MRTFTELFRKSQHSVEAFRTDFIHDYNAIKKNPGTPYVHITRNSGTTMIMMQSEAEIWKETEEVIKTNPTQNDFRRYYTEVVNWKLTLLNHYIENPNLFHFFDGQKLKKVNSETAQKVVREWHRKTMNGLHVRLQEQMKTRS